MSHAASTRPRAPSPRPNVVVVVLDDVGFAQFGCYGGSIETPAIDALAADGLRYTNFHTTGICSSTRASLLVGRNHHAVGIGTVIDFSNGAPGYTGRLPRDARTLAVAVFDADGEHVYRTALREQ